MLDKPNCLIFSTKLSTDDTSKSTLAVTFKPYQLQNMDTTLPQNYVFNVLDINITYLGFIFDYISTPILSRKKQWVRNKCLHWYSIQCLRTYLDSWSIINNKWTFKQIHLRAVVVAQLVEQWLPAPEVRSSNPVIGKLYISFTHTVKYWQEGSSGL